MYLARVKAGHDRNQYYVVQSQDEKFVYLVNGTTRTCDRPRKKREIPMETGFPGRRQVERRIML